MKREAQENLKLLDTVIDGLTEIQDRPDVLNNMTDTELENFLDGLQTINSDIEAMLDEHQQLDMVQAEAFLNSMGLYFAVNEEEKQDIIQKFKEMGKPLNIIDIK